MMYLFTLKSFIQLTLTLILITPYQWQLLPIPGRTKARRLPVYDRGMKYDQSKSYVLLETNEGDTPRIVVECSVVQCIALQCSVV